MSTATREQHTRKRRGIIHKGTKTSGASQENNKEQDNKFATQPLPSVTCSLHMDQTSTQSRCLGQNTLTIAVSDQNILTMSRTCGLGGKFYFRKLFHPCCPVCDFPGSGGSTCGRNSIPGQGRTQEFHPGNWFRQGGIGSSQGVLWFREGSVPPM